MRFAASPRTSNRLVALVDVNNFYASCEKVFNPGLHGRPVVVLSNNDGIVIARSQEAKDLGIPMGKAVHKVRDVLEREQVRVFSSNYALYGDMSSRVVTGTRECISILPPTCKRNVWSETLRTFTLGTALIASTTVIAWSWPDVLIVKSRTISPFDVCTTSTP